jgi:hypothetical protein
VQKPVSIGIRAAIFDAYHAVLADRAAFLALVWKPLAIALAAQLVAMLASVAMRSPALLQLVLPVFLACACFFAVSWHRRVLLEERWPRIGLRAAIRYARPASIVLLVQVVFFVPLVVVAFALEAPEIWFLAAVSLGTWFGVRLMTLLPAAALDRKQTIREAWRTTRGQGVRLWLAGWFAILPFLLVPKLFVLAVDAGEGSRVALAIALELVASVVYFVQLAIMVGFASSVFRQSSADLRETPALAT